MSARAHYPPSDPLRAALDRSPAGPIGDLFTWAEHQGRKPAAPAPQNPCTLPADPPPEAAAIRSVLAAHTTRSSPITAPAIAAQAGLWPDLRDVDRGTRVRDVIRDWYEHLLIPGHILVASGAGYWHTTDPDDLSHQDASLLSRIRGDAHRLRRIRVAARLAGFVHHGRGRWSRPSLP